MKWMGFHSRFQLKLMNIESHPSGKRRSQFLEPSVFACFELNNFAFRAHPINQGENSLIL